MLLTRAEPAGHSGRRSQSVVGKGTKGIHSLANCFVTQGKDKWILPVPPLLWLTFSEGFRGSTQTNDGLNESSNSCHHDSGVRNMCLGGTPNSNRALNRYARVCMSIYCLMDDQSGCRAGCLMDDQCTFPYTFSLQCGFAAISAIPLT